MVEYKKIISGNQLRAQSFTRIENKLRLNRSIFMCTGLYRFSKWPQSNRTSHISSLEIRFSSLFVMCRILVLGQGIELLCIAFFMSNCPWPKIYKRKHVYCCICCICVCVWICEIIELIGIICGNKSVLYRNVIEFTYNWIYMLSMEQWERKGRKHKTRSI